MDKCFLKKWKTIVRVFLSESPTQKKVKICNSISHSDLRMRQVSLLKIDDLISISDFLINGPQNQAQNEKLR